MTRRKRIWVPDAFYHIISSGNHRENLFHDDGDFKTFLYILQTVNRKTPFELASYCLMNNHFHLQLRSRKQPVSKVMFRINKRYADYFNKKNNFTGHVFEKRFFDKIIDTKAGMLEVSRNIHLNPVAAGLVEKAESYRWSSYRYYLYTQKVPFLNMNVILDYFSGNEVERRRKYQEFVEGRVSEVLLI